MLSAFKVTLRTPLRTKVSEIANGWLLGPDALNFHLSSLVVEKIELPFLNTKKKYTFECGQDILFLLAMKKK